MHNLLVIPGVKLAAIGKEQPASRSMLRNHEKFPSVSRYTGPGVNADGWVEIYLGPGIDRGLAVGYLTRHTTL